MASTIDLIEYLPGSLYFLSAHAAPTVSSSSSTNNDDTTSTPNGSSSSLYRMEYISVEKEFPYANYYLDFGPLHLGQVFSFARLLNEKLCAIGHYEEDANNATDQDQDHDQDDTDRSNTDNQDDSSSSASSSSLLNSRICLYVSRIPQHRANAVCLLGCWAILLKKWTAERAFQAFQDLPLPHFHDASPKIDPFGLTVLHVLKGLERAVRYGLCPSVEDFDCGSFMDDMDPYHRDLTWITPQIAAFAGPQSSQNWVHRAKPQELVQYFQSQGVTLVVRCNSAKYDKQIFTQMGIQVVDLYFPDGTCPSKEIVDTFLSLCESHHHTKIAVHCKAGLGRTGTLIACHLMTKRFQFSAEEAIGWLRLCRPGSVIGRQQQFLREWQPYIAGLPKPCAAATREKPSGSAQHKEQLNPEDDDNSAVEELPRLPPPGPPALSSAPPLAPSRCATRPVVKGIAGRIRRPVAADSIMTSSFGLTPGKPTRSTALRPPKIPGRKAVATALSASAGLASQGDLLLLRRQRTPTKEHQQLLPLGTSLWDSPQPQVATI